MCFVSLDTEIKTHTCQVVALTGHSCPLGPVTKHLC